MMQEEPQRKSQPRDSLLPSRPSSSLFSAASPNQSQELGHSPTEVRRSSLAGPSSPPRVFEDNFMLDSLNDQKTVTPGTAFHCREKSAGPPRGVHSSVPMPLSQAKECLDVSQTRDKADGNRFMDILATAIAHFEDQPRETKMLRKEVRKLPPNPTGERCSKHSPTSSYNSSNITTANSTGEQRSEDEAELPHTKKEYCSLLAKYNELKGNNKSLMNDYAVLRSKFEEMKAVPVSLSSNLRHFR